MIRKFLVIAAAVAVFAACGNGNQQAKPEGDAAPETKSKTEECDKKCSESEAVCIGKAIENPADYAANETVFSAKVVKCSESGNYFASAGEEKSIEIVPAEGVALADVEGKVVALTGKVVDGKIQVSAVKEAACCDEKKEGEGCCSEKGKQANAENAGEKKEEAKS